jgi:N-carbamoylputrescine amidase
MTLAGADVILYPSAIGSEPHDPTLDSRGHWRRVMQGHAGANLVPVVASNRVGTESFALRTPTQGTVAASEISFYGTSFITDAQGAVRCTCTLSYLM